MATGLEALGAASAVVQLIAFAGSLVSLSFKIYDGIPTTENELEEYSNKMMEAARGVQSRGAVVPQGTQVTDKLSNVSQECIDTASKLKKEAQTLTKRYKNGKGKIYKAVYSAFRTESHKVKLNQLNESLKKCRELMETELLLKICDQDTAIAQQQSQGFRSLEVDVQNLILKIAKGYTKVEQLVSIEAQATRDVITTHVTSELKALEIKNISDSQRQRLLKSLKPEEIRERYNAVLPSSDACFERVFASYERVCRQDSSYKAWDRTNPIMSYGKGITSHQVDEIDLIWDGFRTWLQSDDKLFWIRGKPGSGKSTLIKFVINNDNTKRLLSSWRPNTKILSHFFWKIGSEPQNSIKGMLCSLLYDLLSEDDDAIDKVLKEFKFSESKDFYKEWSYQEVEKVLWYLLDASAHPNCIFVDGLDEISDKDGYQALLNVVQRLTTCRGVKICVSSRPETELVRGLEKNGVPNLRLDDLTKPEMAVYLQKEFQRLPKEHSAYLHFEYFTKTLLEKAQGVFLWLTLATNSVTNGIMNGDDKKTLSQRLEELPEELESLYQTMWDRLNGNSRVYRETAARYFRFVLTDGWDRSLGKNGHYCSMREPNLVQLSLAMKFEDRFIFPPQTNEKTLSELHDLCNATERDVQIRCAGMLQVDRKSGFTEDKYEMELPKAIYPLTRPVHFIHRTAHDFLVDTEAGQSIVNYKTNETKPLDTDLKLVKSWLNLVNTFYREFDIASNVTRALFDCSRLNSKGVNPEQTLEILGTIKSLYENGALDLYDWSWRPNRPFQSVAAIYLVGFDDFVISSLTPTSSPELTTNSLYELALTTQIFTYGEIPVRIIRRLIELGGEAHIAKRCDLSFELPVSGMAVTQHTTAFESLLHGALAWDLATAYKYRRTRSFLDVIEILSQTCPDLHRRAIVFLVKHGEILSHRVHPLRPFCDVKAWVTLEVDLQFLVNRLLNAADLQKIPAESNNRIHELAASFTKPYARVRNIIRWQEEEGKAHCYRVLHQAPLMQIIDRFGLEADYFESFEGVMKAIDRPSDGSTNPGSRFPLDCFEEVPIEEEMDVLIKEGIGLHREEDFRLVNIVPPLEPVRLPAGSQDALSIGLMKASLVPKPSHSY
ncbi:uncharacterized protein FPRO_01936 [Fusarium proliferatum ET1]|uniref:Related to small s protein n=1 Tax=Fusarium proliferatum (strain ET1) TaxID=1227346 RepID=A0A1L7UYY7_FUSPR|nr:uncharacterized protein FPRO_01936 [Fusarium proliferatum ET1]CZR32856.1 related to small s protein [Fusarium proliferatum ET1]